MKQIYVLIASLFFATATFAQKSKNTIVNPPKPSVYDQSLLGNVKYRLLGPFRGGRSGAVTGSYKAKNTFYFGVYSIIDPHHSIPNMVVKDYSGENIKRGIS